MSPALPPRGTGQSRRLQTLARSRDAAGCCSCPRSCSPCPSRCWCWDVWFLLGEAAFPHITPAFPCPRSVPCLVPCCRHGAAPTPITPLSSHLPSITLPPIALLAGDISEAPVALVQLWLCYGSSCCPSPPWELCAWASWRNTHPTVCAVPAVPCQCQGSRGPGQVGRANAPVFPSFFSSFSSRAASREAAATRWLGGASLWVKFPKQLPLLCQTTCCRRKTLSESRRQPALTADAALAPSAERLHSPRAEQLRGDRPPICCSDPPAIPALTTCLHTSSHQLGRLALTGSG